MEFFSILAHLPLLCKNAKRLFCHAWRGKAEIFEFLFLTLPNFMNS
jgi:hypothetical protein